MQAIGRREIEGRGPADREQMRGPAGDVAGGAAAGDQNLAFAIRQQPGDLNEGAIDGVERCKDGAPIGVDHATGEVDHFAVVKYGHPLPPGLVFLIAA